jgi:hypothetical protein
VQRGERGAELVPEDPGERERVGLDHSDLDSQVTCRRCHLGPDEPGTDHHEAAAGQQVMAQRDRVLEGPQGVDPGELGSGERPGPRSGGQHDAVGRDLPSRGQHDSTSRIQPGGRVAEAPLQVEVGVGIRRQREVVDTDLVGQELLRQGRSVVREPVLGAHDDDAAVEPVLAQGTRRADAGERASDDRDGAHQAAASTGTVTRT